MSSDPLRIDFPGLPSGSGKANQGKKGTGPGKKKGTGPGRRSGRGRILRAAGFTLGAILLAGLPFFTLLRASVFFYHRYDLTAWPSLAGGAVTTVLLLLVYMVLVSLRLGGKGRVPKTFRRGAGLLVGAYCLYALIYLSSANAKTEEIRATYSGLSPILRVAVSTLLLVDRDGVLTGTGRAPEDYGTMGMTVNEASLHFPQKDGFVYAVDVRTLRRPEWRNRAVAFYFRALGFETLRHVGTADHLHVSLPPNRETLGMAWSLGQPGEALLTN